TVGVFHLRALLEVDDGGGHRVETVTRPLSAHIPRPTTSSGRISTTSRVRGWFRRVIRGLLRGRSRWSAGGTGPRAAGDRAGRSTADVRRRWPRGSGTR